MKVWDEVIETDGPIRAALDICAMPMPDVIDVTTYPIPDTDGESVTCEFVPSANSVDLQAENKRLRVALQWALGRVLAIMIIEPADNEQRRVNRACRSTIEDINIALESAKGKG